MLCLTGIFIQDWKNRHIHVVLPIVIFICSCIAVGKSGKLFLSGVIQNAAFFLLILSVLVVYMSIRKKNIQNPFKNYFGLGDFIFYLSVTPLFATKQFIVYFILSMFFSIIMQKALRKQMVDSSVPLAGFSSLFLSIVILKDLLFTFQKITLL